MVGWFAVGLWGVSLVIGAVMFIHGYTEPASDGRIAIILNQRETAFIMSEMRGLMTVLQGIVHGLAINDREAIQEAARAGGAERIAGVPATLMVKLPVTFKEQGLAVHAAFDDIATTAAQGSDRDALLWRLNEQLNRCIACHDTFRFR